MATLSADATTSQQHPHRGLHVALWIVQGLLGAAFLLAGVGKSTQPMAELATQLPWTTVVGTGLTRFIGVVELLGGLGLILPAATRVMPRLTPLAAAGLTLVMILAALFHAARGEWAGIAINAVFGGLAAFVAWGRFQKAPIAPRR